MIRRCRIRYLGGGGSIRRIINGITFYRSGK